jgi:hypothetical protein
LESSCPPVPFRAGESGPTDRSAGYSPGFARRASANDQWVWTMRHPSGSRR